MNRVAHTILENGRSLEASEECMPIKEILTLIQREVNKMNSIDYLPKELYKKLVLFFAGKVHDEIKIDFYQKIQDHNQKIRIFVKDEFCDYSFLESLAKGSNVI